MVTRDSVDIHFWLTNDPAIPKLTGCRVNVEGIDELYAEFQLLDIIHPADPLGDKPWGLREFSMHPAQLLEVKQQVMMSDTAQLAVRVAKLLKADEPDKISEQLDKL